jgi:hypothetical protein
MIFDISGQRDRAVNEYNLALRTYDNYANGAGRGCAVFEEAVRAEEEPFATRS